MIESRSRVIDGVEYKVTQLPATEALKLLRVLSMSAMPAVPPLLNAVKTALPSVMQAFKSQERKEGSEWLSFLLGAVDWNNLADSLRTLVERCDEQTLTLLVNKLLQPPHLIIDKNAFQAELLKMSPEDRIQVYFGGATLTMLKVIAFALEVNYADFLGFLPSRAPDSAAPATTNSPVSTPPSSPPIAP